MDPKIILALIFEKDSLKYFYIDTIVVIYIYYRTCKTTLQTFKIQDLMNVLFFD